MKFACEASALTTEPPGPVVVEVTRKPIYTNALGSVPTQYFILSKYFTPTLFSFFFLSAFHSIFFPPLPSLLLPFVLLTFSFFFSLLFCSYFSFFSSFYFLPPLLFPFLFLYLVCPTNHFKCPATFEHGRTYCPDTQKTYLEL